MSMTETLTVAPESMEDRLAPKLVTFPAPMKGRLLRSRSFNMLRQFPAYFCSRNTSQDILLWLYNSRTKLSTYFSQLQKEAHKVLLILSVWCCIFLIALQMTWCLSVITASAASLPPGMIFMITCIIVMCSMGARLAFEPPKTLRISRKLH